MQNLRQMLGLPVLEIESGAQIGEVAEIIVDVEQLVVDRFITTSSALFTMESSLAFRDVAKVGCDAVMVRNERVLQHVESQLLGNQYYLRDLFDKQLFTDSGLRLGTLADIIIDHSTGEMKWYQVSDSIITDLLHGRRIMPLPQVQVIGPDKVIVPETMASLLQFEEEK